MHHYEKFDTYSKKCKLAEMQNIGFNKMKEAAEKMFITGLISVKLNFKNNY